MFHVNFFISLIVHENSPKSVHENSPKRAHEISPLKCPLEFTQTLSMRSHPKCPREVTQKMSMKSHPKVSTKSHPTHLLDTNFSGSLHNFMFFQNKNSGCTLTGQLYLDYTSVGSRTVLSQEVPGRSRNGTRQDLETLLQRKRKD